jgi:chromosome segregation ATPase
MPTHAQDTHINLPPHLIGLFTPVPTGENSRINSIHLESTMASNVVDGMRQAVEQMRRHLDNCQTAIEAVSNSLAHMETRLEAYSNILPRTVSASRPIMTAVEHFQARIPDRPDYDHMSE